jgi:bifunctional DNA-binding transcriptional regulator/antitoxin component of YhaV-PrlF toxin-antitoxin module
LIPIGTPQPWLYHPQSADPMTYIPFGQTKPIGQQPQSADPAACYIPHQTKLLPSGVMQPAPSDDGLDGFSNRSPDARGTLCVPSQLLHEAGLQPGDKVAVVAETQGDKPVLIVRKRAASDVGLTEYTVDRYGNVRVTAFTLIQGKLPGPTYSFEGTDSQVCVF